MTRLEAALLELAEAIREEVRAEAEAGPRTPDRLLDIEAAGAMLGQGRTSVYRAIQTGRLRSVKAGRRRLVPASAIADYIAEHAA